MYVAGLQNPLYRFCCIIKRLSAMLVKNVRVYFVTAQLETCTVNTSIKHSLTEIQYLHVLLY